MSSASSDGDGDGDRGTDAPTRVAIACQGGGSHTAFTAGVLERLLADRPADHEITALTGSSGGAICAVLAWYGLRTAGPDADPAARATALLDDFWADLAARTPAERLANDAVVRSARLLDAGAPVPRLGAAANPLAAAGRAWLRRTLTARLDGPALADLVVAPDADPPHPVPTVLVGAVDVADGGFDVFTDRPEVGARPDRTAPDGSAGRLARPARPLSVDAVLASAAVPPLFDAVGIRGPDGRTRRYWDGLLSQNPPVRNLLTGPATAARKPDEIWLVRINPTRREEPVRTLAAVDDRRNELAGSLSLRQELDFLARVNRWLREGAFTDRAAARYKPVTVRAIELDEDRLDPPRSLVAATKLDRAGGFLDDLRALGRTQADEFLADRTATRYLEVG
jgi:NTE family protein